jgi:hypothetical protein
LADSLSDRFWFNLRPRAMALSRPMGFPEALLAKLKPLEGKTYVTRQEYLHALEQAIGAEELAANKERPAQGRPLFRTTAAGRTR